MGIGSGIFLFVVGAVLAFALQGNPVSFVDVHMVGLILMGAGVVIFLLSLALVFKKSKTVTMTSIAVDPATGQRVERQENSSEMNS